MTTFDYSKPLSDADIAAGKHRKRVGGKWARMGKHQLAFLREHGLQPDAKLLDVGCGSLRAGIHFARYLDKGNYYGIDINADLLRAGYEVEMPPAVRRKVPREHLRQTYRFECDFGVPFDYAIAQSVFTHVSLNHMRLALYQVGKVMRRGGKFYATFFEQPEDYPLDGIVESNRGRFTEKNIFWYYRSDMAWAAGFGPWQFRYIGEWGHPVGQVMVEYTRT